MPGRLPSPLPTPPAHSPRQTGRSIRAQLPGNCASRLTGISQDFASLPDFFPSLQCFPHSLIFPTPYQFLQEHFLNKPLVEEQSSQGLLLGNWIQELYEIPKLVAFQQLVLSTLGLFSLLRTPRSHLMVSPLHIVFSLHHSYPN